MQKQSTLLDHLVTKNVAASAVSKAQSNYFSLIERFGCRTLVSGPPRHPIHSDLFTAEIGNQLAAKSPKIRWPSEIRNVTRKVESLVAGQELHYQARLEGR